MLLCVLAITIMTDLSPPLSLPLSLPPSPSLSTTPLHSRASVDRSLPVGGVAAASEQLQPVYETKALVAEQAKKMEVIMTQLRVRSLGVW